MFLMIDNYDSFVYNLVRYLEELGEIVAVYRNDAISIAHIQAMAPQGIILSPGPKAPKDAGICQAIVHTFQGKIPILGVCLGHQTIGYSFGARIVKGPEPVHGKVSTIRHDGKGLFKGLPLTFGVTRYHSLVIEKSTLPPCFEITCETDDHVIMGIRHKKYCLEGVQFHPEAERTEYGHALLQNFITLCQTYKA